jgi:ABC-type Fe3+ transport system permease subunit
LTVSAYPEKSQATTILILGILGLLCCAPLGIVSWVMGNNEIAAMDAGRRDPAQRSTANGGRILGIVAVALWAVGLVVATITGVFSGSFWPFG